MQGVAKIARGEGNVALIDAPEPQAGPGVTNWRSGARVTSETYFSVCVRCRFCRDSFPILCPERRSIGSKADGAFTCYLLLPQHNLQRLPDHVDGRTGALTEPLACCIHALDADAGLKDQPMRGAIRC